MHRSGDGNVRYVHIFVVGHEPFELSDGEELLSAFAKLGLAEPVAVIADIGNLRSVAVAARRLMASERAAEKISAVALIVGSPVSRAIGNFFIRFNRPPFPARLFDDEASARVFIESLARPL